MTESQLAAQKHYGDALKLELFPKLIEALWAVKHSTTKAQIAEAVMLVHTALDKAEPAIAADAAYADFKRKNPTYDLPKTAATVTTIG